MADDSAVKAAREFLDSDAGEMCWRTDKPEALVNLLETFARERVLAELQEIAAAKCPACKDKAALINDEQTGRWAHERPGLPNFLCQAPQLVAQRIKQIEERKP